MRRIRRTAEKRQIVKETHRFGNHNLFVVYY